MKRLLLDINSIVSYYTLGFATGVGRSTMELVKALNKIDHIPFDIVLYSQNLKGIGARNIESKCSKLHFWIPNRPKFKRITDVLKLKKIVSNYDLMHIPHNTDTWEHIGKTIYTIHDLIVYRYPEMWGLTDKEREEHRFIAKNCRAITTCSQTSKDDIVRFWNIPPEKVHVIQWGLSRDVFKPSGTDIDEGFFFSASCNHPRKNTSLIVEAFIRYCANGGKSRLLLLNPNEKDLADGKDLIETGRIKILRNIDETTLISTYQKAKATIVASLYEGFGLPVLESLGCHTQVICAHNSSLTEAGGKIVDYLEDLTAECLAEKLLEYDSLEKAQTLDVESAELHLRNFTWEKCAEGYIEFWMTELNKGK